MKKAGLSDETIILSIEKETPDYDTSASGLISLKEAGVSEAVIQKMISPAPAAAPAQVSKFATLPLPSIAPAEVKPTEGGRYFLRYSLHVEEGEYLTTNYARGAVIPINTPVLVMEIKKKGLVLKRTDNDEVIKITNVEKYTKKDSGQIARGLLSAEPTHLDQLPEELAVAIKAGEMRLGMTKELTLMARGFPPAHETPSTEGDRWVYWSSRFVKQTVLFTNDRLVEGRGIR